MSNLKDEVIKLRREIASGKADQTLFKIIVLMERMATRLETLEARK